MATPQDLVNADRNLGTLDEVINSDDESVVTRTGKEILTIQGAMKSISDSESMVGSAASDALGAISDAENSVQQELQDAIARTGYNFIGEFTDGGTLESRVDALRYEGEWYRWDGTLPKIVPAGSNPTAEGGIGSGAWLSVGDAALRSNITQFGGTIGDVGGAALKTVSGEDKRTQNRAVFSFTFDDGYLSALDSVKPIFDNNNVKCGFALNFNRLRTAGRIDAKLAKELNEDGYEILSHGLSTTNLSTTDDEQLVRSETSGSFDEFIQAGISVKSFVANNSVINPPLAYITKEKYNSAFVRYKGGESGVSALQDQDLDLHNLFRTNCFLLGLNGCKEVVDIAIAQGGLVHFYDHDPSRTNNPQSMLASQLQELVEYIIASGGVIATPSEANDLVHSSTIKSVDIRRVSERQVIDSGYKENLIFSPSFQNFGDFGVSPSLRDWSVSNASINTGSGSCSVSRSGDDIPQLHIDVDSNYASGDQIIIQNRAFSPVIYDNFPAYCFSVYMRAQSGLPSGWTVTVAIQVRSSFGSVLEYESVSEPITPDLSFRRLSQNIPVVGGGSDWVINTVVRLTATQGAVSGRLSLLKPCLNWGNDPALWSSSKKFSRFPVYRELAPTPVPTAARTKIPFPSFSNNGIVSESGGSLVIEQNGVYAISFSCSFSGLSSGNRVIASIRLNNSGLDQYNVDSYAATASATATTSATLYLERGDIIDIFGWQNSGSQLNTLAQYTWVNVQLVDANQ